MRISLLVLLLTAALSGQKVPLTHEAMWLMKRVGAPVPSPDGKWVVFPVTEPAYDPKDQSSDLWIVPATGGSPRKLTFTRGAESDPAWSPDSSKLAFSATRDGDSSSQIYLLDLAGGEAQRLTSVPGGAAGPKWSPDGSRILFTANVAPASTRKSNARVFDGYPIRHWDRWLDESRAHIFVTSAKPGSPATDILAGSQWSKTAGMAGPLSNSGEDLSPIWTPDGKSIVFQSDINRHEAAHKITISKLFLVPAEGGEPQVLTSGQYSYSSPKFRPDGQALYMLESREGVDGITFSLNRLAMIPWPQGGIPKNLTASLDHAIGDFVFHEATKSVFFTFDHQGLGKLGKILYDGSGFAEHPQKSGNFANLSAAAGVLFANYDSATAPAEILRLDFLKGELKPITDFNSQSLAKLDLPALRHFWFTSKKGRQIHSLLALPPGFDEKKKYPLVVLIHGGPHSLWKDQFFLRWNYHLIAAPGYIVLMTNYTGSTGFGEKFAQLIQRDPLATPGDELNQAADEAIRLFPFIDGAKQCAGGASYGGHLSNWLQATTTRYKCLVSHAGLVNLESQWGTSDNSFSRELNNGGPVWLQGEIWKTQNPIRAAAQFKTPTLVTVGERDFRVPLNNTLEYWTVLQRLQIPSRLIVFPDANHWILKAEDSRFFYQELHDWLKRWLN
jgi:dipeptidyl aminopeptidase/acylaminoacyl peptidase